MKHVQQPPRSRLCGQACVAMLTGVTLDAAAATMGHRHGTRTREVVAALGAVAAGHRLTTLRRRREPPSPALCKVTWKRGSHWVIWAAPDVYDPDLPAPLNQDVWLCRLARVGGRVTSFLPLKAGA